MKSLATATAAVLFCSLIAVASFAADKDASKDKKAAAPINKKCPVEKGDVDPEVTVQHEGKTIGFCCAGCDTEFKKDPAKYMAIIAKEEAPAKDAEKDRSKDKKDAKKKDEPKKETELNTKCPVTDDDADKTLTSEYKGRTIAFCCEDCVKDFEKDPKKYIAKLDKEKSGKSGEKKKDDAEREKDGKAEKSGK